MNTILHVLSLKLIEITQVIIKISYAIIVQNASNALA